MTRLFPSFFLGGFECSTHLTIEGHRLDVIAATQHDVQAREDYALCADAGVRAVRESARWPILDRGGTLDLDAVRQLASIGREAGLVQIWDLMHYGYPDELDLFAPAFRDRFARFARAVADAVRAETDEPRFYTPVNEISYNAWAAGEVGYMAPFARGRGGEVKRALVCAAIAAAEAIWEVDPDARMLTVEPLVRLHAPPGRPELQAEARHFNEHVVPEAFDLLAGRLEPELGGSRAHLGVVGLNYYSGNQWTIAVPEAPQRSLDWDDPGWVPLSELLLGVEQRYGGPLVLAETGSSGESRAAWIELPRSRGDAWRSSAASTCRASASTRSCTSPDWEDPTAFFDGGLFDLSPQPDGRLRAGPRPSDRGRAPGRPGRRSTPRTCPGAPLDGRARSRRRASAPALRPRERARFKADNFACDTLLAGDSLTVELLCARTRRRAAWHTGTSRPSICLIVIAGRARVRIGSAARRGRRGRERARSRQATITGSRTPTERTVAGAAGERAEALGRPLLRPPSADARAAIARRKRATSSSTCAVERELVSRVPHRLAPAVHRSPVMELQRRGSRRPGGTLRHRDRVQESGWRPRSSRGRVGGEAGRRLRMCQAEPAG